MRKLTIGMATHNDYDGVYFTIQSIRMYHKEILDDIEFVIVDNSPWDSHGTAVRNFTSWLGEPFQYLPFTKYESTTIKNKVFDLADTPYVICMDSHVMVAPGALKKLITFFDNGQDEGNLLHGPLIYDDLTSISTHFDRTWSEYMWGQWQTDDRGVNPDAPPFEIPSQGMGLFSCRKDSWLGYNKNFRGFGGEEVYIHEKYKKHGKMALCLPFLRWMHRFDRPNGTTYPNNLEDRFRNYLIGFRELGLNTTELLDHFKDVVSPEKVKEIEDEIISLQPPRIAYPQSFQHRSYTTR
jgi:hypothetical protein